MHAILQVGQAIPFHQEILEVLTAQEFPIFPWDQMVPEVLPFQHLQVFQNLREHQQVLVNLALLLDLLLQLGRKDQLLQAVQLDQEGHSLQVLLFLLVALECHFSRQFL
jgi:hypothetical protein